MSGAPWQPTQAFSRAILCSGTESSLPCRAGSLVLASDISLKKTQGFQTLKKRSEDGSVQGMGLKAGILGDLECRELRSLGWCPQPWAGFT